MYSLDSNKNELELPVLDASFKVVNLERWIASVAHERVCVISAE